MTSVKPVMHEQAVRLLLGSRFQAVRMLVSEWQAQCDVLQNLHNFTATRSDQENDLLAAHGEELAELQVACDHLRNEVQEQDRQRDILTREIAFAEQVAASLPLRVWHTILHLFGRELHPDDRAKRRRVHAQQAHHIDEWLTRERVHLHQQERRLAILQDPLADARFAKDQLLSRQQQVREAIAAKQEALRAIIAEVAEHWNADLWQKILVTRQGDQSARSLVQDMRALGSLLDERRVLRAVLGIVDSEPSDGTCEPLDDLRQAVANGQENVHHDFTAVIPVKGDGYHHVKRRRTNTKGSSSTYWDKVSVRFDDQQVIQHSLSTVSWNAEALRDWSQQHIATLIADGRKRYATDIREEYDALESQITVTMDKVMNVLFGAQPTVERVAS